MSSSLLQLHPAKTNPHNQAHLFDLHCADVSEGVSELFRLDLVLREKPLDGPAFCLPSGVLPPPPSADFDLWLGEQLAVEILTGELPPSRQLFHGVVTEYQPDGSGAMKLVLEPRLALYRERVRTRTFVNHDVGDVIRQVLKECDVDYKFPDKLKRQPLITQYRESDAAFVLRLIAENKLCFVFEHSADKHVMFIGQSPRMHLPAIAPVLKPNFRLHHLDDFTPAVMKWQPRRTFRAGQFERLEVKAAAPGQVKRSATTSPTAGAREKLITKSSPSPTGYPDDPPMNTEHSDWGRTVIDAGGTHLVRPGELLNGPGAGNDNQFTVVRVRHSIQAGLTGNTAGYFNSFTTVPKKAGFVAEPLHHPRVRGPSYATVVAVDGTASKPGTVALTAGRVWVRIDEDTSPTPKVPVRLATWLPDTFAPPRVGQRVVVDYEDGNPDRPMVVAIAPVPTPSAMPHDPEQWPAAYTSRFPPTEPTGNKDDDAVVQVHDGRVVVQAPGGFFAHARKLLSLIGLGGLFARAKTITLSADEDIILQGKKISIVAGGCRFVMDGENIAIDCPGKIFLGGGGPAASNAIDPDDKGKPL